MTSSVDRVREELAAHFRATVRERVASALNGWSAIERRGAWDNTNELLGELHTLKGEARLMGYAGCAALTHLAEDLVAKCRSEGAAPQAATGDALFSMLAAVERRAAGKASDDRDDDDEVKGFSARVHDSDQAPAPEVERRTEAPASIATLGQTQDNAIQDLRSESLDQFSDTARELVAAHVRYEIVLREIGRSLAALADMQSPAIKQALANHALLTEDVHRGHVHASRMNERALALRLAPMQRTFDRFTRPMRELGRSLGKDVVLETSGGEVMLDRHVATRLFDPLMHLLRNAIDHGIEMPDERVRHGKPARATVRLSVIQASSRVIVRIEDDGGGFDLEAIRRRARDRGLIDADEELTQDEVIALTFTPGFSTRDHTTETSGRGVGLDVVKRAIDHIGGVLRVSTQRGQGSTFELDVPATLSLTEVLLVTVGERAFALPTLGLRQVTTIEDARPTRVNGRPAIVLHGEPIPYAPLAHVLGMGEGNATRTVVLANERSAVAIGVDSWRDVLECVVTPLPAALSAERLLVGATVIGGGTLALVLNASELLQRSLGVDTAPATRNIEPAKTAAKRRILLVEDSVIIRTMLARLLAAAGYAVREAEDGAHALELLEAEAFDVVLTDLDMPRLDGFGLIAAIRASDRHSNLPIVVLTTRGAESDRARATAAGANAYLTKTNFSEAELRQTLERQYA